MFTKGVWQGLRTSLTQAFSGFRKGIAGAACEFIGCCCLLLCSLTIFTIAAETTTEETLNRVKAPKPTLTLVTTEYPPFYGKNLTNFGVIPDISLQALKRMGYEVNIKSYPFARAIRLVQDGKVDGIIGLWFREARQSWAYYSAPLMSHDIRLYKKRDTLTTNMSLSSLIGYRIGIGRGYANPDLFVKAKLKTEAASSDSINLRKLFHQRIDLTLMSQDVAQYLISQKQSYLEVFEPIGVPLGTETFHFAIGIKRAEHQRIIADFNQGIRLLKTEGVLEQIIINHGFNGSRTPDLESLSSPMEYPRAQSPSDPLAGKRGHSQ